MKLTTEQRDALHLLGWVHLQCGRPAQAQVLLDSLVLAEPAHLAGRRALVVAALEVGDAGLAEQHCLALQQAGEQHAGLWLCLSQAQQMAGRLEQAQASYRHYLQRRGG